MVDFVSGIFFNDCLQSPDMVETIERKDKKPGDVVLFNGKPWIVENYLGADKYVRIFDLNAFAVIDSDDKLELPGFTEAYNAGKYRYIKGKPATEKLVNEEPCLKTCWNCYSSTSLPAHEAFDDGSVCDYDRLVCLSDPDNPKVVQENENCSNHIGAC